MVDTVVFTIEQLSRDYPEVLQYLTESTNVKNRVNKYANLDKNIDVSRCRSEIMLQQWQYEKNNKSLIAINGKMSIKSWEYNIAINYNLYKDELKFQLSLPKHLYGTNIFQFLDHKGDTYFNINSTPKDVEKYVYDKLKFTIKKIFAYVFWGLELDLKNVSIDRIDLCFNLIMDSKEEAFRYIAHLKNYRKRWIRDKSNKFNSYDTSIYYAGKERTFKIYHKGSEFQRHDSVQLKKINNLSGSKIYDIELLQSLADRMVRYEVEYRPRYYSRIFKAKVFRKNSVDWKLKKFDYRKVENYLKCNKDQLKIKEQFSYEQLKNHKMIDQFYNVTNKFYLEQSAESRQFSNDDIPFKLKNGRYRFLKHSLFSKTLLSLLIDDFIQFFNEYKIDIMPLDQNIKKMVDDYNKINSKKIRSSTIQKYLDLLHNSSKDELIKSGKYTRQQVYNIEKMLKNISGYEINPYIFANESFNVELSFRKYFELTNFFKNFLLFNT